VPPLSIRVQVHSTPHTPLGNPEGDFLFLFTFFTLE
jgi:hypothetical protein